MPFSPGRILPNEMTGRQWGELMRGVQASNRINSFTPTWSGFSADPSGVIYYHDFGATVEMWSDVALSGTSDAATFSLTGVPTALWPRDNRYSMCFVIDANATSFGGAIVQNSGGIIFQLGQQNGTATVIPNAVFFTASSVKGLPSGWMVRYPK